MKTIRESTELQQKIESLTARIKEQDEAIAKMTALIKYYESQLLANKRRLFGVSSEKTQIDIRQTTLFGEPTITALPEVESETETVTYTRKKRKGKREEDLSSLPVERVDYELSEEERHCPQCGDTMRDIGVDIRRELKLIPAQVVVVEHASHAYACENCEKTSCNTPIMKTESPKPLISGSLASPSFIAYIISQKYSNGLPLYRIEKGFQYEGVVISRQTMSNWVINCTITYLVAIYSLLKVFLLKETVIHADETTTQVLHELGRSPQSKSYEWVYRTRVRVVMPNVVWHI